jgi:hypothetical protein
MIYHSPHYIPNPSQHLLFLSFFQGTFARQPEVGSMLQKRDQCAEIETPEAGAAPSGDS